MLPQPTNSPQPTALPTSQPTLGTIGEANSWKYIFNTMKIYAYMFAAQYALFETFRGIANVYESRRPTYDKRCSSDRGFGPPPVRSRWPIVGWLIPTLRVGDEELLFLVGLDSYVLVRYVRLCWKITAFSTLVCLALLVPVYASGGETANMDCTAEARQDATDDELCAQQQFSIYTLANAVNRDNVGVMTADEELPMLLWVAAVVAAYVLALQTCLLVRAEYRHFRDLRLAFFVRGDPQVDSQCLYTVMVENVPPQYRLNVQFRLLFDTLFPGKVHSSEMMQPLSSLRWAVLKAEECALKLEDAQLARRYTGPQKEQRIFVGPWYGRLLPASLLQSLLGSEPGEVAAWRVPAAAYWRSKLRKANQRIKLLQKAHFQAVIPREEAARRQLERGVGQRGTFQSQASPGQASCDDVAARVRAQSEGIVLAMRDPRGDPTHTRQQTPTRQASGGLDSSFGLFSPFTERQGAIKQMLWGQEHRYHAHFNAPLAEGAEGPLADSEEAEEDAALQRMGRRLSRAWSKAVNLAQHMFGLVGHSLEGRLQALGRKGDCKH